MDGILTNMTMNLQTHSKVKNTLTTSDHQFPNKGLNQEKQLVLFCVCMRKLTTSTDWTKAD
jgi:hypothetical protein